MLFYLEDPNNTKDKKENDDNTKKVEDLKMAKEKTKNTKEKKEKNKNTMKALKYLLNFILISRKQYEQTKDNIDKKLYEDEKESFEKDIEKVIEYINITLSLTDLDLMSAQALFLKSSYEVFDLIGELLGFNESTALLLLKNLNSISERKDYLQDTKLNYFSNIIVGKIISHEKTRVVLLPRIIEEIITYLNDFSKMESKFSTTGLKNKTIITLKELILNLEHNAKGINFFKYKVVFQM
jgi:hypothetical protein